MVYFMKKEVAFIQNEEVARVSTISPLGWSQTTPILHVFDGTNFYFVTEFDTKKYKNLKLNNRISLVVDKYARTPQGISVQGTAEILEEGDAFLYAYDLLVKRHEYHKANPFKEREAPIIKITPVRKASWDI